jgi:hypothetical protein
MNFNSNAITIAIILGLVAGTNYAKPSLAPSVQTPEDADKTIVIKDATKYVNVFANETVLFKVGANQFAIKFDGVKETYNLAKLAPDGMLTHPVKVYVTPIAGAIDTGP